MRESGERMKAVAVVVMVMMAMAAMAFQPIPKASARALGVTRGKSFSKGVVFINGKYLPPPYVVERWGTGIRINSTPVTGQIVDWNEFLKTQSGVKTVTTEPESSAAPELAAPEVEAEPTNDVQQVESAVESAEADVNSLDDLFEDDSDENDVKKKPKARPVSKPKVIRKPAPPPKPRATVSYVLEGDFVPNEETRALVKRINQTRTDVDRTLRSGGFICFGDKYPNLSGDSRLLKKLLAKLPELQQQATEEAAFVSAAYAANIVYLNDTLLRELYKNRIDYLQLKRLRAKLNENLDALLMGD